MIWLALSGGWILFVSRNATLLTVNIDPTDTFIWNDFKPFG